MTHPLLRVCAEPDIAACAGALRPTHIVSLIPSTEAAAAARATGATHHRLPIPDVERAADAPWALDTARALLTLGAALGPEDRVLIHCWAGVSRSTAAALLLDLAGAPITPSAIDAAVARLLEARPGALPNGSLLGAADALLGLPGSLSAARATILGRRFAALAACAE